ncbi:MAG: hypothetical protein A2Y20_11065 [Firmicutes bacterium GWF2_51_9]|nr:MAG: hypothetical protein A2Y20_11065 [Firmicutes bacterium GWF2_51_9]OGS57516.1 MAG: hypothetical protein A2Y19_06600 [Firmicutes bacterium GWE2_51_13]HAM62928.1 hypothetical protein [Erysipelotrichaceae bacterium]HBZ42085.1 hypothetical protein [Erysipelotrichaceae bacterium]
MDKAEFKNLCKKVFYENGFTKNKHGYFIENNDYLLAIFLQKSNYGMCYYVNVSYSVKGYNTKIPNITGEWDADFMGRITFPFLDGNIRKLSSMLELDKFEVAEIEPYFLEAFREWIFPIFQGGKKQAIENIGKYFGPPHNILCHSIGLHEYLLKESAK